MRLVWFFAALPAVLAYFSIISPSTNSSWFNNQPNLLRWSKSPSKDGGVYSFDIELVRTTVDGLIFVAKDVPATEDSGALNIFIEDIPAGGDYTVVCLNSTHGRVYATSNTFTVSNSAGSSSDPHAPTITVTTSNATQGFATTFANSVIIAPPHIPNALTWIIGTVLLGSIFGVLVL